MSTKLTYRDVFEYPKEPKVVKPYEDAKRITFAKYISRYYQTHRRKRVKRREAVRQGYYAAWRQARCHLNGTPLSEADQRRVRLSKRKFVFSVDDEERGQGELTVSAL